MEINGYENYLIYPSGKVWSKVSKRYLSDCDCNGYRQIKLYKDGKGMGTYLHRLLAEHFIENPDNLKEIDHIDRNKANNKLNNLRWITRGDNNQNKDKQSNNVSGVKNISPCGVGFQYQKRVNHQIHRKWFKTLEEAVEYKTNYEKNM